MLRLDQLLVKLGRCESRTQAQRIIKEGRVALLQDSWVIANKPSLNLAEDTPLRITPDESDQYVSRGALKLKAGLDLRGISVTDAVAIDVGQSTGGFTDLLLQRGAKKVVGIEVGQGQLAEKLRCDPRVICLEKYNARNLTSDLLAHTEDAGFDLAVMDVSFISQRLILEQLSTLLKPSGYLISLVKPQFELGHEHIGKGGIVKSKAQYPKLEQCMRSFVAGIGLSVEGYIDSPIKGGDGNMEFILIARKNPPTQN